MKILILCSGNTCRSQMAHGFLQLFDNSLFIRSAGTEASGKINNKAVQVMAETGIDISHHISDSIDLYLDEEWNYIVTVCEGAKEACPVYINKVKQRIHIGFEDPSHTTGTDEFIWSEFERVRDEIKKEFYRFYIEKIKPDLKDNTGEMICFCKGVRRKEILDAISQGAKTVAEISRLTTACSGTDCKRTNPNGICCRNEIENILMKSDKKNVVKEKYSEIASQSKNINENPCDGAPSCCSSVDYTIFSEDYSKLKGYNPDADLGLGCGLPTEFAGIKKGEHVLDLGSGTGNDCFIARALVGDSGKVTGLDFTDTMLERAIENNRKLEYKNVKFIKGDIEKMPLGDSKYDVVISNCVLNLVPDKEKAFKEIYRVLKYGGHFSISDVVIVGKLPESIKNDAEMYAGCVSGAIDKDKYLEIIKDSGFSEVEIKKSKEIVIPNTVLLNYMTMDELRQFKKDKTGIFSITVNASK